MSDPITRRRFLGSAALAGASAASVLAETPAGKRTIIDSHVHLRHGNAAHTEYSPEVIVRTMDQAGIDRSVVFAMSTTTKHSIEMAEAAVKRFPGRLIPYVYALPSYERPALLEMEAALSRGFRGIKIHAGECTLAEYVVDPVLRLAAERGVPCLIDFCGKHGDAQRIAGAFPTARVIVAHMGKYLCTDGGLIDQFLALAEKHENMLLDLSGVVLLPKVEEAVRRIGSHRLVWGTDGPDQKPDTASFARRELDKIERLNLSEADKTNILGRTISRLLKLQSA